MKKSVFSPSIGRISGQSYGHPFCRTGVRAIGLSSTTVPMLVLKFLTSFVLLVLLAAALFPARAADGIPVRITADGHVLEAVFEDNATSRSLIGRFPLTVPMRDLYDREMCYHFRESLPTDNVRRQDYEIGDIAYWTPGHSLVIFYEQNGEIIGDLQKIGRVLSGMDIFFATGDTDVTFELAK